jgi:hypothetical protein
MRRQGHLPDLSNAFASLDDLGPSAAKELLRVQLNKTQQSRITRLLVRGQKGSITDGERRELDTLVRFANFLTLVHSKARIALKKQPLRTPRRKSA